MPDYSTIRNIETDVLIPSDDELDWGTTVRTDLAMGTQQPTDNSLLGLETGLDQDVNLDSSIDTGISQLTRHQMTQSSASSSKRPCTITKNAMGQITITNKPLSSTATGHQQWILSEQSSKTRKRQADSANDNGSEPLPKVSDYLQSETAQALDNVAENTNIFGDMLGQNLWQPQELMEPHLELPESSEFGAATDNIEEQSTPSGDILAQNLWEPQEFFEPHLQLPFPDTRQPCLGTA